LGRNGPTMARKVEKVEIALRRLKGIYIRGEEGHPGVCVTVAARLQQCQKKYVRVCSPNRRLVLSGEIFGTFGLVRRRLGPAQILRSLSSITAVVISQDDCLEISGLAHTEVDIYYWLVVGTFSSENRISSTTGLFLRPL
jgi:hypothetical protein